MIDSHDQRTLDAFPIKKRGRLATGKAKTPAQRKREQRERDRAAVFSVGQNNLQSVTLTALLEQMRHCVANNLELLAQDIAAELVRRSKRKT